MNSIRSDKSKQFSILINDELKSSIDEENDEDDENEKPLLDAKDKTGSKKKPMNCKKGGYYELSKQERENVNELFESNNSKVVNAIDYDDEDEFEESDDEYKEEETNEQTQLTRHKKKKGRHNDKSTLRKKLFGGISMNNKPSLSKQSSTDDELLGLGKIKILIPRKKNKSKLIRYKIRKCMRNFFSLCFLTSAVIVVFILLYLKRQYLNEFVKDHLSSPSSSVKRTLDQQSKHCDMLIVNNLWNVSLPKLIIDSPLKLLDVNMDGNLDILIPFRTSIDQKNYNSYLCRIYFNQTDLASNDDSEICGGGVLALDGLNGKELWRTYSKHELNSINCFVDLDGDEIPECFVTGKRAQIMMISGGTGRMPLIIKDVDEDGFNDILVMHGGDYQRKTKSQAAKLIALSSRQGSILFWDYVPDNQDSFIPPLSIYRNQNKDPDNIQIIYATGGFNKKGSLWSISLNEFLNKKTLKNSIEIHKNCFFLTPPVLVDLNKDHIQDIVIACNSTVAAYDGRTFVELWHTKLPKNTQFYIQPAVGHFDDDDTPDFFVQYELGDDFSNGYSEVQVLNGLNGKMMLKDSFKMLTSSWSSPLTVSVDVKGSKPKSISKSTLKSINNTADDQTIESFDLFLFWQTTCDNQEQELKKLTSGSQLEKPKSKLKYSSIDDLKKADFCKLRFNKKSVNRLNSISFGNIMTTIYDSNERADKELEQNTKFNWTKIGKDYLSRNTELLFNYMANYDKENGYVNENENKDKSDPIEDNINNDDGPNGRNNVIYYPNRFMPGLPGLNDKRDYPSLRRQNDYSSFNQDKFSFSQPGPQPNLNQNDNLFNQNDLANLIFSELKKKQAKIPPPYSNTDFDFNSNRNRFVRKKSSPYDDRSTLEEIFRQRRIKRSALTDDAEFIHKVFSTATLIPSKLENDIDLVFSTNWILDSKNEETTKKPLIDKPFKNQMASTTVYRNSLRCKNTDFFMKPYVKQIWPSYLGLYTNGTANV